MMRTNNFFRKLLGITQAEKATWLGVSRSEINMTERRSRSLPTYAHLRLCRLEIALQQLPAEKQMLGHKAPTDTADCCRLLQQHLAACQQKLYKLEDTFYQLQTRYNRLQCRSQTLELMHSCSGPDCTEAQQKWLHYAIFINNQHLARIKPGQLFLMQHRIDMLQGEIAATQHAMASLSVVSSACDEPKMLNRFLCEEAAGG